MSNNIRASADFACSGCGACAALCPKNAISLKLNSAGFQEAEIDGERCVNCGLCQKVCTRYYSEIRGVSLHDAALYALQCCNVDTVRRCSSGGAAHELMVQAIRQGKKVIGVVYNTQTDRAEHVIADWEEEITRFDGSKYLQSDPRGTFRAALEDRDRAYLVVGTPCQIAGFSKAAELLHVRDRFLLVEIFCHGVPSYKVWAEECERIRKKLGAERFDNVRFRYKKDDWHSYCLRVDAGGKTFYGSRERELFWQVFFENVLLGDSCQNCRMRKEMSLADIRLGDYWGRKFQHRSDGVSAAFACTQKGKEALEQLLEEGRVVALEATDCAEMLRAQNMAGYQQQELHEQAMEVLRRQGVKPAVRCYRRRQHPKQKLKRTLIAASAVLPDGLRAKLRKATSGLRMKKYKK